MRREVGSGELCVPFSISLLVFELFFFWQGGGGPAHGSGLRRPLRQYRPMSRDSSIAVDARA